MEPPTHPAGPHNTPGGQALSPSWAERLPEVVAQGSRGQLQAWQRAGSPPHPGPAHQKGPWSGVLKGSGAGRSPPASHHRGPAQPSTCGPPSLRLCSCRAPYRHCLGPSNGLCAGLGAWLLGVRLCWCVQGHAMLRGDRGLAGVVLGGVRWGRGILGGDAVLWRRRVLGGGIGLGHRFRRGRGVLSTLQRERERLVRPSVHGTLPQLYSWQPLPGLLGGGSPRTGGHLHTLVKPEYTEGLF